jgi:hypothetical protein
MVHCLSTARHYLSRALSAVLPAVGADESLPFFISAVVLARLRFLPAIVDVIVKFARPSLHGIAAAEYYIQQLEASSDFIAQRLIPVPPFLLSPMAPMPPGKEAVLVDAGNGPLTLHGFAVFAFPTWSAQHIAGCPPMLRYTGVDSDIAVCGQFKMEPEGGFMKLLPEGVGGPAPTSYGSFFEVSQEMIRSAWMVKVDSGDVIKEAAEIEAMSAVQLMTETRIRDVSTGKLAQLYAEVRREWKLTEVEPIAGIQKMMAEIQMGLIQMGKFGQSQTATGMMDLTTMMALKECFAKKEECFTFKPKMLDFIRHHVRGI